MTVTCALHQTAATGTCARCLKPTCNACSVYVGSQDVCTGCVGAVRRAKSIRTAVIGVVIVAAVAVGGLALLTRNRLPATTNAKASFDYGSHAADVSRLRTRLAETPCDRRLIVDYGEVLLRSGDNRGAIAACDGFFAHCGQYPRLRWVKFSAHQYLSEWDLAVAEATTLIDADPFDKDYWWWRGQSYAEQGKLEEAARDYQQAISLEPRLKSIPFNLIQVYRKLNRPCDGLHTLERYLDTYPAHRREPNVQRLLEELGTSACGELAGKGRARVEFRPRSSTVVTSATLNGKHKGRFIVDTGATFVTISAALADKLGIDYARGEKMYLQTGGGQRRARLATIDELVVQGATARSIEVAVVDELPIETDGLLGLSFLSRFDMNLDLARGVLELKEQPRPSSQL